MRILHISDLHYHSKDEQQQTRVIRKLIEKLRSLRSIDLVIFSGDLVFSGENYESFIKVQQILFTQLVQNNIIDYENIFFCAGNHDIDRNKEIKALSEYIENNINTNEKLNKFLEDEHQYDLSLNGIKNYNKFATNYNTQHYPKTDECKDLYSIHYRNIGNKKIGIATLNSAWRSLSDEDRGNLLIPTKIVLKQIEKLQHCDWKLMILHHSLSYLKEFNEHEIENLIYENFHMQFSGHIHKRKQGTYATAEEGIFCSITPAVLAHSNKEKIGFTILENDSYDFLIENYIYEPQDNEVLKGKSIEATIPLSKEKSKQNNFRKKLRKKLDNEIGKANDLLVDKKNEGNKTFLELFSTPVIKEQSIAEAMEEKSISRAVQNISLPKLRNTSNYIIYGKNKSGKSSLLQKLLIDCLAEFQECQILPLYIDFQDFERVGREIDITNEISKYYEISKEEVKRKEKKYHYKILVDNFNPNNDQLTRHLYDFADKHNCSFILCSDLSYLDYYNKLPSGQNIIKLYIHDLSRSEVRTFTDKSLECEEDEKEDIIDKIIEIFSQLSIPFNYWTVSLFVWIFRRNKRVNLQNHVELIKLYIEGLLERTKLALSGNRVEFENLENYLGELAHHLLTSHFKTAYHASYEDLVEFTRVYRNNHLRFNIDTREILDYLINRGVLKQNNEGLYCFRLNGVFEFFLAYYMSNSPEFLNEVINDESFYLSFGNELEICSGLRKRDNALLNKILKKTDEIFLNVVNRYKGFDSYDKILNAKMIEIQEFNKVIRDFARTPESKKPLSPQSKDKLLEELKPLTQFDESVQKKEPISNSDYKDYINLEKAIMILMRTFRNLDLVMDKSIIEETFDKIIRYCILLGFYAADELKYELKEILSGEDFNGMDFEEVVYQITVNFVPVITQTLVADGIAHQNITRLVENRIEDILSKNSENDQYELFILFFILLDIDINKYISKLEDLEKFIKNKSLVNASIIKLYFYLIFKSYSKVSIQSKLKKGIYNESRKLDPKTDKKELYNKIEKVSKKANIESKHFLN